MPQTKKQIEAMLGEIGVRPRHRFGQNFMIDPNMVRTIADAASIQPGDQVIEVGPGTGTLTEELLSRGAHVLAIEIDRDLSRLLRQRFTDNSHFALLEGDALAGKHELNPDLLAHLAAVRRTAGSAATIKLVSNLPYNIASPLIIELLLAGVESLTFTVQKEVADRLHASADSEHYGPLSVMAQLLSRVELLRTIPPEVFWPRPKIDSALVRLTHDDRLGERARPFSSFVQRLFSARRKTLRKALAQHDYPAERMLATTKLDGTVRPEKLSPMQLLTLFDARAR